MDQYHACMETIVYQPMAETCSIIPLSDEGTQWEDSMTMSNVGPGGRRQCDEVMTEVDERFNVLPVIEVVVL